MFDGRDVPPGFCPALEVPRGDLQEAWRVEQGRGVFGLHCHGCELRGCAGLGEPMGPSSDLRPRAQGAGSAVACTRMRVVLAACLLPLCAAAAPRGNYALCFTGMHHGEELGTLPPAGWMALGAQGLFPVDVQVTAARDEIIDASEPPEVMTGREVSVTPAPPPGRPFILRGLKAGAGEAREVSAPLPVSLYQERKVQLGKAWTLAVVEREAGGFKLVLADRKRRQVLYRQEGGEVEGWTLYWAGDLDRDGRLDLVLSADSNANVTTLRLFLSSEAAPGELLREVATFTRSGC